VKPAIFASVNHVRIWSWN